MIPDLLKSQIYAEINKLEGWTTPERACLFAEQIVKHRPMKCVEVGVFGGRSLIAQAMALEHNQKGVIYGVDPWRTINTLEGENSENQEWWKKVNLHDIHKGCMEAIWRLGLEDRAVVLRCTGAQAQNLFPNWSLDSVFIDGNHSEVASVRDVRQWSEKLHGGGLLWMDDCDWPSTAAALKIVEDRFEKLSEFGALRLYRSPKSNFRAGRKPKWAAKPRIEISSFSEKPQAAIATPNPPG
jgi:predicted O-methyltransferase YrrM